MHKESSLVALQTIDVIVYKSCHHALSAGEVTELQDACRRLTYSVQSDPCLAKKAAWIVELIQAAFLESADRAGSHRDEILKCGISLSLYIQRQPDGDGRPAEGEGVR